MTSAEQESFVKAQVADVQAATDRFTPARYLPVKIDFMDDPRDPYELSAHVVYDNTVVHVEMEHGFKWDGASIPFWWVLIPWIANLVIAHYAGELWMWGVAIPLLAYTYRLLPYMQKMGLHARAACVHDKLYRTQAVGYRVVADAILLSIMESDGVPWDVRYQIYAHVRGYGWLAWRANAKALQQQRNEL